MRRLSRNRGHPGGRSLDGKADDWKAANVADAVVGGARSVALPVSPGASYILAQGPRVDAVPARSA